MTLFQAKLVDRNMDFFLEEKWQSKPVLYKTLNDLKPKALFTLQCCAG